MAPKRILVVDDVRLNRVVLGKLLLRLGYDVVYGSNGYEAVDVFQTLAADRADNLFCILMDINMPDLDGLQATQLIRQLEDLHKRDAAMPAAAAPDGRGSGSCAAAGTSTVRRVPIIAVSACSETEQLLSPALANVDVSTERPWRACGMDCWLDKPVNQAKLRSALARLEAGAPLEPSLWEPPQGGDGNPRACERAACGLSQPAGPSMRPLSADCAEFPAMRARPGSQQVAQRGLGASVQHALAAAANPAGLLADARAPKRAAQPAAEPRAAKRGGVGSNPISACPASDGAPAGGVCLGGRGHPCVSA